MTIRKNRRVKITDAKINIANEENKILEKKTSFSDSWVLEDLNCILFVIL
tara:strand:+ start:245 stop:394 length:150 start_codon:yes stop_codon:yes gene_type:complete